MNIANDSASPHRPQPDSEAGGNDDFRLPIDGFQGTPEEIERQWFRQVYTGRGDRMPQLTWRAVLMGSLLGGVLSLTNLYIGLKAGWGFGVAITACILSYAIWTTLYRLRIARTPMSILENNCMQSTASAAGYSTGGTLVSAFAAYMMLGNAELSTPILLGWVFFLAVLGVTMAIPMKRQMINVEQLRFPSGIAAAETLRALHSHGEKGMRAAKALGIAGCLAAISQFWADGLRLIHPALEQSSISAWIQKLNVALLGPAWMGRTVMLVWDPIFLAAGTLTGLRVAASMMLGATLCWCIFVPALEDQQVIAGSGYQALAQWTVWGGVSCMVTSGILSFALQWRSMLRALGSLGQLFGKKKPRTPNEDPAVPGSPGESRKLTESQLETIETPMSWFLWGQLAALVALAWLAKTTFAMPYWESVLAVLLSFFLALVACRVTGETDTTPVGPMGKVTQLIFGAISPGNTTSNLMSANITAGAATSSADLLTDLKSGYLLGAHPRKQFLAQFAGVFVGTLVTVLCFKVLVPDALVLGTDQFPAPAAQVWRAVAVALSQGLATLGPIKLWSIAVGGLVGVVLPLAASAWPRRAKWIPSPAGLGLAWTFHWYYSLLFFLGAVVGWLFTLKMPRQSEEYTYPVASGIIAGGSLMGVLIVIWENGPLIFRQLLG